MCVCVCVCACVCVCVRACVRICVCVSEPLHCSLPPLQWFVFREAYMSRVDKTEDHVQKLFREYQDNWSKYAEGLERGGDSIKVCSQ